MKLNAYQVVRMYEESRQGRINITQELVDINEELLSCKRLLARAQAGIVYFKKKKAQQEELRSAHDETTKKLIPIYSQAKILVENVEKTRKKLAALDTKKAKREKVLKEFNSLK